MECDGYINVYSHKVGGLVRYRAIALHTSFEMEQVDQVSCAVLILGLLGPDYFRARYLFQLAIDLRAHQTIPSTRREIDTNAPWRPRIV